MHYNISEVDIFETITAVVAVAAVGAATVGATIDGGIVTGLSSMAGMGAVPAGLPQPGTSKYIKKAYCQARRSTLKLYLKR